MKKLLSGVMACLLSACASHSGIVPIGQGVLMASKQQATGLPGLGNMKAELVAEGTAHCRAQGLEFELVSAQETKPPYVLGNYPRSEISFRCVPKP
jgi:phage tail sheath gpL-like